MSVLWTLRDVRRGEVILRAVWRPGGLEWRAARTPDGREADQILRRLVRRLKQDRPELPTLPPNRAPFSLHRGEHANWVMSRLDGLHGGRWSVRRDGAITSSGPASRIPRGGVA